MATPLTKTMPLPGEKMLDWFEPPAGNLRTIVLLIVLAAVAFFFLMPLFNAPFERDQGTYATIARGWIHGYLPYRDLWDNKGPLLFLWYAASFLILGENTAAPRIAAALCAGISVPFLWGAARRLFGRREAALGSILFALSFANVYLQVTANAEIFMLLPLTAGFWAFAAGTKSKKNSWFLLSGIFNALAVFTRQSALLAFIGYGAWMAVIYARSPGERRRQIAAASAMAAGAVLGALPFVIYFGVHGALHDLWYAMFAFNLGWAADQSFLLKFVPPVFVEPGPLVGGLAFWIMAVAGVRCLWKRNDQASWLVISFLAFSEAAAQAMGKGSAHYSIQLLPGAAICAAFGFPQVIGWWKTGSGRRKVLFASAVCVTVAALLFAYTRPNAESRFLVQYTYRDYAYDAVDASAIAKAVAENSAPADCIYEWGRSSQIYFLAGRQPCSSWFYDRPYEVNKGIMTKIMKDLWARRPAVILITGEIPPPRELADLIKTEYRYAGRVKYAELYVRSSHSGLPDARGAWDSGRLAPGMAKSAALGSADA